MDDELLSLLLRANLALAVAILFVLAMRRPVRRWLGARIAYGLWLIPLVAVATYFLPARVVTVTIAASPVDPNEIDPVFFSPIASPPAHVASPAFDAPAMLVAVWAGGVLLCLAILGFRQARFTRTLGRLTPRREWGEGVFGAETALAGPAVIGVVRPRIVAPSDFDRRYSPDEQRIVIAHERAHLAHGDPLINSITALVQCLAWFNPLAHIGAGALRTDQEFACDAAVIARAAHARRTYAEALLKAHGPAPAFGCAWPTPDFATIKERILMLKGPSLTRMQTLAAASVIALTVGAACAVAWAAQPARVVTVFERAEEAPMLAEQSDAAFADASWEKQADDDLAGGPADDDFTSNYDFDNDFDFYDLGEVDAEAIGEQVREAMEGLREALAERREAMAEHREAMAEARAAIAEADDELRAHAEELAAAEAEITEAEIAEITQRAMAEARADLDAARRQLADASPVVVDADNSSAMRELQRQTRALALRAMELASAELEGGAFDESARAAAEAELEAQAARIEALAAEVEAEMEARFAERRGIYRKSLSAEDCEE